MCYRAAVLLALLCGLRLGEVGALRLSDVDWEHCTIDIGHALKYTPETGNFEGDPKTEAGERLISLPAGMMAVLHETRAYQEDAAATVGDVWVGEGWIVHAWKANQQIRKRQYAPRNKGEERRTAEALHRRGSGR